jgi:hypothetical protein
MKRAENSQSGSEHKLSDISGFPPEMIDPLASRWIQTGEELLAVAVAPDGEAGLAELLIVDRDQLNDALDIVRQAIGQEHASAIESKARCGGPLGVRFSDEQKRRMGLDDSNAGGPDR